MRQIQQRATTGDTLNFSPGADELLSSSPPPSGATNSMPQTGDVNAQNQGGKGEGQRQTLPPRLLDRLIGPVRNFMKVQQRHILDSRDRDLGACCISDAVIKNDEPSLAAKQGVKIVIVIFRQNIRTEAWTCRNCCRNRKSRILLSTSPQAYPKPCNWERTVTTCICQFSIKHGGLTVCRTELEPFSKACQTFQAVLDTATGSTARNQ